MSNARRMAVTLGLDENLDTAALVHALRGNRGNGKPRRRGSSRRWSKTGPILENVVKGGRLDLSSSLHRDGTSTTAAATSVPASRW